ncbi:serine hydrolase [Haliscomenobacter hydrossis]|uniref:Secreted protein n=1 Tax=Haliscomenobacter hydrossis (strain ATCC 27775 / DSM 1100 / LMG 10767 / O) TaxID=760192 RepID=F4KQI1_HALH1|nr:serine hydrolase [Haliscomenobacter hydrossis]AEE49970.1 secreted protein [Haliscomenobacter hydrossis DSM 1100]
MQKPILLAFSLCLALLSGLTAQKNPLRLILEKQGPALDTILNNVDRYQVQIIYTQIDRDANNFPTFRSYTYNLDTNLYYYPASAVKMPAAFLALEKLNQIKVEGLSKYSPMHTGAGRPPQTSVTVDTTAENDQPSIAQYIKKIFLVSDNDAFNRLYEFLGQEYLNKQLWNKGYKRTRIIHRLSVPGFDVESNRYTNPISFFDSLRKPIFQQGQVNSMAYPRLNLRKQLQGKGYIEGDSTMINQPFDFLNRNYVGLEELHDMLKAVLFPEAVRPEQRFDLTESDYKFLYRWMSAYPRESTHPSYPEHAEEDNYVKFLLFGDKKAPMTIPNNIRIFNKVGLAYGFLTDAAYIVDFEHGVEFMLAATIRVNNDEVFNDGKYEYDEIGLPFLGKVGQAIYVNELQRPKLVRPVLAKFKVEEGE